MKIMELKTKEDRNDYLYNEVPEHLRTLVKNHVQIWFERRKFQRDHHVGGHINSLRRQLLS